MKNILQFPSLTIILALSHHLFGHKFPPIARVRKLRLSPLHTQHFAIIHDDGRYDLVMFLGGEHACPSF